MRKYDLRANKRFGQNFLVDDEILQGIIESANLSNNDIVIEIGPGLGNLTEYILKRARFVIAVEIDSNMIRVLKDRFKGNEKINIINEDILKIDINNLIEKVKIENNIKYGNVKVIANLPYYITTPIIFKLLETDNLVEEITIMIQKEVASRIVAKSKSSDYGILSVMANYYAKSDICLLVPNTSFVPSPKVTSAVVKLVKHKQYNVKDEKIFFELVHASFANKRKKMINSLEISKFMNFSKSDLKQIFTKLQINENVRAEELEILDFVKISDFIYENYVYKA